MYQVEYGSFPQQMTDPGSTGNYCPTPVDTKYCIKPTSGNTYAYSSTTPYQNFIMDTSNTNNTTKYRTTNDSAPVSAMPTDTVTIGTQTWMKYNLDVGTMINGATAQTNNSVIEKWCYDNDPVNCIIYGGMYQWDEMMQYVTAEGAQGIAPTGFHIATDAEYTVLSNYLGGEAVAGDKMKSYGLCQNRANCDTSGFSGLLGGSGNGGSFSGLGSYKYGILWSSSQIDASNAWRRDLYMNYAPVYRYSAPKSSGNLVRAIKN
jgi:uncharacterized protein (TIGR02145 family)